MAYPVYVLLPEGAEWTNVPGTSAQKSSPVRWYLRQWMPEAATQTAVLASAEGADLEAALWLIDDRATALGGITVDCRTQMPLDPTTATAAQRSTSPQG